MGRLLQVSLIGLDAPEPLVALDDGTGAIVVRRAIVSRDRGVQRRLIARGAGGELAEVGDEGRAFQVTQAEVGYREPQQQVRITTGTLPESIEVLERAAKQCRLRRDGRRRLQLVCDVGNGRVSKRRSLVEANVGQTCLPEVIEDQATQGEERDANHQRLRPVALDEPAERIERDHPGSEDSLALQVAAQVPLELESRRIAARWVLI